ncbi:MAG: glycosyltransferase [Clostridium sp.]|nr:glycosyltransferase [Clostridium sp.]MCM1172235.1 glycosyltransferase [Clostridium sp.]MCM1209283.1 glycosyltransferase [Ruminococcus sp.]
MGGPGDVIKKGWDYLKNNGMNGVMSQVRYKLSGPGPAYNGWYKEVHEGDEEAFALQRKAHFRYEPVISIIVPVYLTPEFYLRSMIASVQAQTYKNWQLCLVDGSQGESIHDNGGNKLSAYDRMHGLETEKIVRQYMLEDDRISYQLLQENKGISENANTAIAMSTGDYIAVLAHDDILTEDALYYVVEALNEYKYELIYSDEDKMSEDGSKYSQPAFKPDFSIDLLRSYNYISHLLVVERNLAMECGGFRSEFDEAWSYDFILRCCEKTQEIKHIPRVLYHKRITGKSADNAAKQELEKEAGKSALASHIARCKLYATVTLPNVKEPYKVVYETPGNPFLSIIIPGNKNTALLEKCIRPLFEYARYSNFEIIIVDYDGEDEKMLKFYQRMERQRKNITVVLDKKSNTPGKLRNFGASHAKGDYLLFLDSNTELIEPASIGEMLGICMRQEVGVVSGITYNENNMINSAGIIVGLNGSYDYIYRGMRKGEPGYLMNNLANRNCSAVSSRCMLVKAGLFNILKGFSSDYMSRLADIDFCLRVREMNYIIVCAARAAWQVHPDPVSLTSELAHMPKERMQGHFRGEENIFRNLWSYIMENGDPYYNINFTREGSPFTLQKPS